MKLKKFIEQCQSKGVYSFTTKEAIEETGMTEAGFYNATSRLKSENKLIHPKQGFYVIVRPEERASGSPSPFNYVERLMGYLDSSYYVGLLSAALIHGATHQQPQVFQVVTKNRIRSVRKKAVNVQFVFNKDFEETPLITQKTRSGYIKVSTCEATAVDVVYYSKKAGGLNNAANILIELAREKKLAPDKLLTAAVDMHSQATLQRLGFMLDKFGFTGITGPLSDWVSKNTVSRVPLLSNGKRAGVPQDKKWKVMVNTEIEPDVV